MSRIVIAWSMLAAVYVALALQHLLLWSRQRKSWVNLLFSATATITAGKAAVELLMMRAETAEAYGAALRWYHVLIWALAIALLGFVRLYLRAGRPWLASLIFVLRTMALILNFLGTPNLNYQGPTYLRHIRLLGEPAALVEGATNPWMIVGQLSLGLLVLFVLDATITAWRRGDRQRALIVGGSTVLFVTTAVVQGTLTVLGLLQMPIITSLYYLGMAAAMSFQLSEDLLRAAQLDRELQESQLRLSLAAEAARIGFWVYDMRTDELWVSEQSRAMLGTCCGEKISLRQFLDDVHPDDRRALEGAMRQSLHGGGGFEREYRRLRPDGRIGWVAVFGRVEYGQDGRPVRARGVSLDITQRMEAELAAQQHRDELARLNRVHLLGVLSASLSHELNQPLTAILSNAQAAQRFLAGPAPDLTEVQSILHDISEDDRRAADIIRRLRGVLQQGEVARQPLDVNVIIHEVLRLLRADLWHRQIVIQTSLAAELPPIQGDRVQLQQVLINLILNGCDAMADNQPGRRTLRISTGWAEDRRVKICFADQGQGVLPEQREVIFQPFFTTKAQGMGLGLAVCRAIVTAHRGEVWAEGEPDGGALLCVSLPVHLESRV